MKQKTIALCLALVMILAAIPLGVFALELPSESTESELNSPAPTETPIEETPMPSEVPPTVEPEPAPSTEPSETVPTPEATETPTEDSSAESAEATPTPTVEPAEETPEPSTEPTAEPTESPKEPVNELGEKLIEDGFNFPGEPMLRGIGIGNYVLSTPGYPPRSPLTNPPTTPTFGKDPNAMVRYIYYNRYGSDTRDQYFKNTPAYTGYCIERGVDTNYPEGYDPMEQLNWQQRSLLGDALAMGINKKGTVGDLENFFDNGRNSNGMKWIATQAVVWEIVAGFGNGAGTPTLYRDSSGKVVHTAQGKNDAHKILNTAADSATAIAYYDSLVQKITDRHKIPSFLASESSKAKTVTLKWNGTNWSTKLTDTNAVLKNYNFRGSGLTFSKSGNTLTVTADKELTAAKQATAEYKAPGGSGAVIAWQNNDPNRQKIASFKETDNLDSVFAYLKFHTENVMGGMKLKKTSEDGIVSNLSFKVTDPQSKAQVAKTNDMGMFELKQLVAGSYKVEEMATTRYEQPQAKNVAVKAGETAVVTFQNNLKKGNVSLKKASEDGILKGLKFVLSGNGKNFEALTNDKGEVSWNDLPVYDSNDKLIQYTVHEETGLRYIQPEDKVFTIEHGKAISITMDNKLKKGSITINKQSEDKIVAGLKFTVTGNGKTWNGVTDSKGQLVFENLPIYDKDNKPIQYVLKENDVPVRYVEPAEQTVTLEAQDTAKAQTRKEDEKPETAVSGLRFGGSGSGGVQALSINFMNYLRPVTPDSPNTSDLPDTPTAPGTPHSPKTGDTRNMLLFVGLGVASLCGLGAVIITLKKKKDSK